MSKRKTTTAGADAPDVRAIHKRLKEIIKNEIEQLPNLLAKLPPADRLNAILELLPYCAPKVKTVEADFGEGFGVDWL